jgi:hypothetical protein
MSDQLEDVTPEPEEPIDEVDLQDLGHFQAEIHRVYDVIHGNEEKRDLVLAEIHVFLSTLDQAMRKMMQSGGPMAMLGNLVGGKKE